MIAKANNPLTLKSLKAIAELVSYDGHRWRFGTMDKGYFVQIQYDEPDIDTSEMCEQHGRKWYVSRYATRSEIVQTMLKAALTSAEHRVREHFTYRGARIFGPHFDVEALLHLTHTGAKDVRKR